MTSQCNNGILAHCLVFILVFVVSFLGQLYSLACFAVAGPRDRAYRPPYRAKNHAEDLQADGPSRNLRSHTQKQVPGLLQTNNYVMHMSRFNLQST